MAIRKITRMELCIFMQENNVDFTDKANQEVEIFQVILSKLKLSENKITQLSQNQLKTSIKDFVRKTVDRYKAQNRHIARLIEHVKPNDYLAKDFLLPDSLFNTKKVETEENAGPSKPSKKALKAS